MARGGQGVQGRRGESPAPSAVGQVYGPARGHSQSELAEFFGLCKSLSERSDPLTPEELAAFNAMRARELAKAETRRSEPSPQGDLEFAA